MIQVSVSYMENCEYKNCSTQACRLVYVDYAIVHVYCERHAEHFIGSVKKLASMGTIRRRKHDALYAILSSVQAKGEDIL